MEPPKHSEGDGPRAAVPAEVIVEEMQRARGGLRALGLQLVLPKCAKALDLVRAAADAEHGRKVVEDFREARGAREHAELHRPDILSAPHPKGLLEVEHPAPAGRGGSFLVLALG